MSDCADKDSKDIKNVSKAIKKYIQRTKENPCLKSKKRYDNNVLSKETITKEIKIIFIKRSKDNSGAEKHNNQNKIH